METPEEEVPAEAPAPELETTEPALDEEAEATIDEALSDTGPTEGDVPADDDVDTADLDALIEEILNDANEVDDKVEEIKQEASSTGNEELLNMIDELQTLLAEKNQQIAELNKKDEITSSRLMDTYGDAENYSFYK